MNGVYNIEIISHGCFLFRSVLLKFKMFQSFVYTNNIHHKLLCYFFNFSQEYIFHVPKAKFTYIIRFREQRCIQFAQWILTLRMSKHRCPV